MVQVNWPGTPSKVPMTVVARRQSRSPYVQVVPGADGKPSDATLPTLFAARASFSTFASYLALKSLSEGASMSV